MAVFWPWFHIMSLCFAEGRCCRSSEFESGSGDAISYLHLPHDSLYPQ